MALVDRVRRAVDRVALQMHRWATRPSGQASPPRPAAQAQPPAYGGVGTIPTPRRPDQGTRAEQQLERDRPEVLRSRVSVNAGPYSDRISGYPASNLDPSKIDRIFRSADLGVAIWQYGELCKQMRERDSHLLGIDRQRRQGVANKPFLLWPSNANDPVQVAMCNAQRAIIKNIDGFKLAVYAMLSKNCDGWSLNEIVWSPGKLRFQIPDGNGGGPLVSVDGLWPRQIFWVHAKHTEFALDSSDEPLLNMGSSGPVRLPRSKFIYSLTPGEGIATARGYSRSVVWQHFFKHASIRDWNVFLHLYGIPYLEGKIQQEYWKNAEFREVLELALQAYGTGESAPILPEGVSINVKDPVSLGGAGQAHAALAGFCNAEQSKAVLGVTLTTEAGDSGSYKLGSVHQDGAQEVVVGDAGTTAEDLARDLLLAAIELNAVPLGRALEDQGIKATPEELAMSVAETAFRTDREWTPKQRLEIFRDAAAIGVTGSKTQVRNELQIDPPNGDDDALKGEPITIADGARAAGAADASDGIDNPKDQPPKSPSPPPKKAEDDEDEGDDE